MKKCCSCYAIKEYSDFYKSSSKKDGTQSKCKTCSKDHYDKYRKTKKGLISVIYGSQISCSDKRNHNRPSYTKNDLQEWLMSNLLFNSLYEKWEESGFDTLLSPSIDRINDYLPYSFDNIRLVTWEQNKAKGHQDRKSGINNKANKAVIRYTKSGVLVDEFHSIQQASRETGIDAGNISTVCDSKIRTTGGYVWKSK